MLAQRAHPEVQAADAGVNATSGLAEFIPHRLPAGFNSSCYIQSEGEQVACSNQGTGGAATRFCTVVPFLMRNRTWLEPGRRPSACDYAESAQPCRRGKAAREVHSLGVA